MLKQDLNKKWTKQNRVNRKWWDFTDNRTKEIQTNNIETYWLCASKEISNIDDICLQNENWARSSFITDSIYNDLEKSTPTNSSLDNNNFRTEFQTHDCFCFFQSRYAGM